MLTYNILIMPKDCKLSVHYAVCAGNVY